MDSSEMMKMFVEMKQKLAALEARNAELEAGRAPFRIKLTEKLGV